MHGRLGPVQHTASPPGRDPQRNCNARSPYWLTPSLTSSECIQGCLPIGLSQICRVFQVCGMEKFQRKLEATDDELCEGAGRVVVALPSWLNAPSQCLRKPLLPRLVLWLIYCAQNPSVNNILAPAAQKLQNV